MKIWLLRNKLAFLLSFINQFWRISFHDYEADFPIITRCMALNKVYFPIMATLGLSKIIFRDGSHYFGETIENIFPHGRGVLLDQNYQLVFEGKFAFGEPLSPRGWYSTSWLY